MVAASLFLTLAGLLDSADGQLARMTGKSSDFGRKIDVLVDLLVFTAAYIGGVLYFFHHGYDWWIVPIAALAGYFHSAKSAVYDFYKTEFIYYLNGGKGSHRIPYLEEVKANPPNKGFWLKVFFYMEIDYYRKQATYHYRNKTIREKFERWALGEESSHFKKSYNDLNEPLLKPWALVGGTNVHRTALMVFSLIGRMDIYFFFSIATMLFLFPMAKWQKRVDDKLVSQMSRQSG